MLLLFLQAMISATRPPNNDGLVIDAFIVWLQCARLSAWLDYQNLQYAPSADCLAKVPLLGMKMASPDSDVSQHGRDYDGVLFHGTGFSHLPAILSAGSLLRSSVPTQGKHAVWAAESLSRALLYSPPVMLGGQAVQVIISLQAKRVKSSHFKSRDKQLMLRECWQEAQFVMICLYKGQQLYRSAVPPLDAFLPAFSWDPAFCNWNALPAPWVVSNEHTIASSSSSSAGNVIPDIPWPLTPSQLPRPS